MKIESLEIKTRNLKKQEQFYNLSLGLDIFHMGVSSFETKIGSSMLRFIEAKNASPYHIAFHIPPAQEKPALEWIKKRVEIQPNGSEEIVDFSAWNARSVYFYDADMNILEFISRDHLYPKSNDVFTKKSILGIAEIGMATSDIFEKYTVLCEICGLEKFDGNFDNFCAIGDDKGLIIAVDKHKKNWFPTNDKACTSDFNMSFEHRAKRFTLSFKEDQLSINQPGN